MYPPVNLPSRSKPPPPPYYTGKRTTLLLPRVDSFQPFIHTRRHSRSTKRRDDHRPVLFLSAGFLGPGLTNTRSLSRGPLEPCALPSFLEVSLSGSGPSWTRELTWNKRKKDRRSEFSRGIIARAPVA